MTREGLVKLETVEENLSLSLSLLSETLPSSSGVVVVAFLLHHPRRSSIVLALFSMNFQRRPERGKNFKGVFDIFPSLVFYHFC